MVLEEVEVELNKQTHPTWWSFLGDSTIYGFEVISTL